MGDKFNKSTRDRITHVSVTKTVTMRMGIVIETYVSHHLIKWGLTVHFQYRLGIKQLY